MEELSKVEAEVNKVFSLFTTNRANSCKSLDDLIHNIESHREELERLMQPNQSTLSPKQSEIISKICDMIEDTCSKIVDSHRQLHVPVTRIGKNINANFIADYSNIVHKNILHSIENNGLLNQAILNHLQRHGMTQVADELVKETGLPSNEKQQQLFNEIGFIMDSFKNKDNRPMLAWAIKNREKLSELGSPLEFKLHEMNIVNLLRQGIPKQQEAIMYARKYFPDVGRQFENEIQYLMGCLPHLRFGLGNSPYHSILNHNKYDEIEQLFVRDACLMLGCSRKSPLTTSFEAGSIALPALLDMNREMMRQNMHHVWQVKDELPVEINFERQLHFHSIFSCPILRQQASESNPPMRLECGHVISKDALGRLIVTSSSGSKIKCTYCSKEQSADNAVQIYF